MATTTAKNRKDVDNMTAEERAWDSLNYSYGKKRESSDKSYNKAISQQDRTMQRRGMGRSSYGMQTLAGLQNEKNKAANDIYSEQIADYENRRYQIEAVRNRDHVFVRISADMQVFEVILALTDTSRYAYISISGEHCKIQNIGIDIDAADTPPETIPRIAEEISYTRNCPQGDIPNIEIDGPRLSSTKGIPIHDSMTLSFHTKSYPTARLIWHCPYFCIFSSSDGSVDGDDYHEYLLLKLNGENWDSTENVENRISVDHTEDFQDWKQWLEQNKQGIDCTVTLKREDNKIIMQTENLGIAINSATTLLDDVNDVYFALTGDQCAITNIRIIE